MKDLDRFSVHLGSPKPGSGWKCPPEADALNSRKYPRVARALGFLLMLGFVPLVVIILSGCTPVVKAEQLSHPALAAFSANERAGQTFVARYDGLSGVTVFLKPGGAGPGAFRLLLRSGPDAQEDLRVSEVQIDTGAEPGYYRFRFAPIPDSANNSYYASIEYDGEGNFAAGSAPGDSYLHGAQYRDGQPEDAQLAFRLIYERAPLIFGLIGEGLQAAGQLLAGIFLFVVPGWALLSCLLPRWVGLSWAEKAGLAAGASLALYPLLLLWTDLIGLRLGPLYAWLPSLLGGLVILWKARSALRTTIAQPRAGIDQLNLPKSLDKKALIPAIILVTILALIFGVRFWIIRGLNIPMWGDSLQHSMIAQLLVDHRGLFSSWEPYTPYRTLTVQYGFPALVAVYTWLTGLPIPEATLVVGQIVNGLAVLALYPLAYRLSGNNPWAGIGAVLAAGLLSPLPIVYLNWGRYAQLAGLTILPATIWLLWEASEPDTTWISSNPKRKSWDNPVSSSTPAPVSGPQSWRKALPFFRNPVLLAGIVAAGMTLSYYRMPIFLMAFMLLWMLGEGLPRFRLDIRCWFKLLLIWLLIGITAILLILPWWPRLVGSNLANVVEGGMQAAAPMQILREDFLAWRSLSIYVPPLLLALAGIGWALAALRKRWLVALLPAWPALLAAYIAGQLFQLPGSNMLQNFAVLISIYLPISCLAGYLIGSLANSGQAAAGSAGSLAASVGLAMLAFWGGASQISVAQPATYALVQTPDERAMEWIRENVQQEALFLVEGFRIWGGSSAVGADAGWWIPLLSGRQNTMPPQYALVNEAPVEDGYSQKIVALVGELEDTRLDSPEGLALLCDWKITHVYIGQGQGSVGAASSQLFTADEMAGNPLFIPVYRQDRVSIYQLAPGACQGAQ